MNPPPPARLTQAMLVALSACSTGCALVELPYFCEVKSIGFDAYVPPATWQSLRQPPPMVLASSVVDQLGRFDFATCVKACDAEGLKGCHRPVMEEQQHQGPIVECRMFYNGRGKIRLTRTLPELSDQIRDPSDPSLYDCQAACRAFGGNDVGTCRFHPPAADLEQTAIICEHHTPAHCTARPLS